MNNTQRDQAVQSLLARLDENNIDWFSGFHTTYKSFEKDLLKKKASPEEVLEVFDFWLEKAKEEMDRRDWENKLNNQL